MKKLRVEIYYFFTSLKMYTYNNITFNHFERNHPSIKVTTNNIKNWKCGDKIVPSIHPPIEEIMIKIGNEEVVTSPLKLQNPLKINYNNKIITLIRQYIQ